MPPMRHPLTPARGTCGAAPDRRRAPAWAVLPALSAVAVALALAACQTVPPATGAMPPPAASAAPPAAVLTPPAALQLQGVPPVPATLAAQLARYTDVAGHSLADWHPGARELLVRHRPADGSTTQLWRVPAPGAAPQQLTDSAEPVGVATCMPPACGQVVFQRSSGGNEANQLYRMPLAGGAPQRLTPPGARHGFNLWLHRSAALVHTSVPLDSAGGPRNALSTTLWQLDPMAPDQRRQLADLPGGGWQAVAASRDDRRLLLQEFLSVSSSRVWLLDTATGQRRQLLPAPGAAAASWQALDFSPDGTRVYLASDAFSEFRELVELRLADGSLRRLSADVPWDLDDFAVSHDGSVLAVLLNIDGRVQLRLQDAGSGALLPMPAALPAGSVRQLQFHPQRRELALAVDNAQGPSQVHSLDLDSGQVHRWTQPRLHPALDTSVFSEPQIVRWTSFDGRSISGLLSRPPARFGGRRPVLIDIHGGPEAQAQVGFGGRQNHLLHDLGVAVLRPNVRGSSGYGKSFLALDNGRLREDAVKDIGALLDWIATQPDLDPARVVVSGGSYGGYMALAVAVHHGARIAGAIDVVGISHFVTFLETTETYRRDLRRVEYGDERDPVMRAFLHSISPLTQAHRITRPLFVVQGKNDPRVPYTEAEQIVARVRANGGTVWYLRADNEGHGFARKENADYLTYTTTLFLQQVLGLPPLR